MTGTRQPSSPPAPTTGDVLLVVAALLTAVVIALKGADVAGADWVTIEVAGKRWYDATIDSSRTLTVEGPIGSTVIRIDEGGARVVSAPCPGQICVSRGWLRAACDVAACVPNHLVLRLTGRRPPAFDGITQ